MRHLAEVKCGPRRKGCNRRFGMAPLRRSQSTERVAQNTLRFSGEQRMSESKDLMDEVRICAAP
ncbi:hypothetical protein IE4771_CH02925 [Rhizobium etli bv. mimosae str. IE4771]|uniref:Uncharacterized protein n=1 Tax=Rhizobium etli bv. mimosae str. IE4771 TaxID=1432050 RepID=A0A060I7T9_RHIET|nr:hypothetical protein IE4771_CH02925 [Rhizobium sp. IE4771]